MGMMFFIKDIKISHAYGQHASTFDDADLDELRPVYLRESFTQLICDNIEGSLDTLPDVVALISFIMSLKGHYLIDIIDVLVLSDDTLIVTSGAPNNEVSNRFYTRPEIHVHPLFQHQ